MAEENTNAQETANTQQSNQSGEGNATNNGGTQTATYTQEQLDSMVQAREQRATNAALKSFFSQQGMTEAEITQAINSYKTTREKSKPDLNAMQTEIQQYKTAQLSAQIEAKATLEAVKMGLSPSTIPYVLKLADMKSVTDDKGTVNDEKLKAALGKVLEDVPQLKNNTAATGFGKVGADGNNSQNQNETEMLKKAFGL